MGYGILFSVVASLCAAIAINQKSYFLLLFWPALSFAIVAAGYLYFGPSIYQKSKDGLLSPISKLLLFPYLLLLWPVWHLARIVKSESSYNQLTEKIWIGRRLLAHEFPQHIEHVIDLTCEFDQSIPSYSVSYHSLPILDGFAPTPTQFCQWVKKVDNLPGNIYIHCAEGHGRTGLFTTLLLLQKGEVETVDEAIAFLQAKRPLVKLRKIQLLTLRQAHNLLLLQISSKSF